MSNKAENDKNSVHIYFPQQEAKLLDALAEASGTTKVSTLREALLLYSEWIQEKTFPSFKMMKVYLKDARETNELLKGEVYSLKAQVQTLREGQVDLIKSLNRLIAKR